MAPRFDCCLTTEEEEETSWDMAFTFESQRHKSDPGASAVRHSTPVRLTCCVRLSRTDRRSVREARQAEVERNAGVSLARWLREA